jgi:hypothetical protein
MFVTIETPVAVSVGSVCDCELPVNGSPPMMFWMSPRSRPSACSVVCAAAATADMSMTRTAFGSGTIHCASGAHSYCDGLSTSPRIIVITFDAMRVASRRRLVSVQSISCIDASPSITETPGICEEVGDRAADVERLAPCQNGFGCCAAAPSRLPP